MKYLENLMASMTETFGDVLPKIFGAIVVLILGFIVAKIIKKIVEKLLKRTKIDEKIGQKLNTSFRIDTFVAKLVYYLIVIYVLLITLNILGVTGVTDSLEGMLSKFTEFLPNLIAAGVIAFAGYMIANIFSEASGFIAERAEKYGQKIGLNTSSISLTKIIKQLVFIVVFIPILIMALDTLKMTAISEPATEMLSKLFNAVPNIIAAAILLGVFFIVGKYVVSILSDLLKNLGINKLGDSFGLSSILGDHTLSSIIGKTAFFFIMFTGIIAAAAKLELGQVQLILENIFNISGKVFFGLIILMGGMTISNIAVSALKNSEGNKFMIPIARFAILGIFFAFALHTMGIAESIVNLAFGLTLGAIAVAFALSFGLGGREAAGNEMKKFFENMKK